MQCKMQVCLHFVRNYFVDKIPEEYEAPTIISALAYVISQILKTQYCSSGL